MLDIHEDVQHLRGQLTMVVTKGRATHLLKRSAKLVSNRKKEKTYPLEMEELKEKEENNKEEHHNDN